VRRGYVRIVALVLPLQRSEYETRTAWIVGIGFLGATACAAAASDEVQPFFLHHDGESRLYRIHLRAERASNCPDESIAFLLKRASAGGLLRVQRDPAAALAVSAFIDRVAAKLGADPASQAAFVEARDRVIEEDSRPPLCLSYGKSLGLAYLDLTRHPVPEDGVFALQLPKGFEVSGVSRFK
jgi:hypothetical protein